MNLRCKHCQPARRSLTALYRAIQRQEGAGAPRHHPDVSLRGAKRRGNLAVHSWITGRPRRKRNCLPEIATAPLGPRNDKSGAFTIVTATGTSRSCGAGRGQPGPYKARAFARRSVQIGSAFPRLPRPRWGLAMTNLLTLRHRIRAAKPTACKAVTPRKGDAASVRRQSRQRLRSDRRYRRNWFVRFIGTLYELQVPSRDCHGRKAPSQ